MLNDIAKTETSFPERPFNLAVVKSINSSMNEALTEFASVSEIKSKNMKKMVVLCNGYSVNVRERGDREIVRVRRENGHEREGRERERRVDMTVLYSFFYAKPRQPTHQ